jgi:hypothetical protein
MSAIKLSTPSSGSISLSPADTASNLTITVPAVTGTMLTTASTGTVLQVVQTSWSAYQGISSSTFADVTASPVSITPKFSTSKILVLVSVANCGKATNNTYLNLLLVRNSTTIASINGIAMTQTTLEQNVGVTINYLDSPATTSSTTYKLQIASGNNNSQAWVNNYQTGVGTAPSTITLMEIAG